MVRYHLNLLNIDSTHPGIRHILLSGGLSVRRSTKPFTRTPIDLTLEQTINADAASQMTGISAFTQNFNARRRWMITHSMRSAILGHLFDMAGLRKPEDSTQELTNHRITRDNSDLQKIISAIQDTQNPFDETINDRHLYCLTTGKATSEQVQTELLHCVETGRRQCETFTNECFANPSRFEKPISRNKLKNFSADAVKVKLTVKDRKIKELQGTRDLFGRLLYLAASNDLDLTLVFSYPLTPVPLALAHVDGSINKTDKSKLMHKLEERVQSDKPVTRDAYAVDAMFLIHTLVNVPVTFGGIAKVLLTRLVEFAKRIDFVCDSYKTQSIKDIEHGIRGSESRQAEYNISGPDQKCPKDFQSPLKSPKFKTALLKFLFREWQTKPYTEQLRGHVLFMGLGKKAYKYEVTDDKVQMEEVPGLFCNHQEADTRLIWHIKHMCDALEDGNIIIRASDTDVLVILLTHSHLLPAHLWLDVGISSNNTRRYIDVSQLATSMGPQLCGAIAGLHAFTGCDFTASFLRKGKVRPLALMEKNEKFLTAFKKLGESPVIPLDLLTDFEAFVCSMYGKPHLTSVNLARNALFHQHFAPKNRFQPLYKIKGTDPSNLPPCRSVLLEKLKRTNLVVSVWKTAIISHSCSWDPQENGWILKDGHYALKWFEGRQVPEDVCNHIDDDLDAELTNDDDDQVEYNSSSDESEDDFE